MLLKDARYALRSLWHSKGFATVAILCLGFGIGLNTTIFSIVDGVLLKPYPYEDPDRIVVLSSANQQAGVDESGMSFPDLTDLRAASKTMTRIASTQGRSLTISDGGEPERYVGAAISWDLFPLLGVAPILGQGFAAEHDRPGGGGVVLISHAVWTVRYHQDPAVLGRRVLVNGTPAVILGVMPERFEFPEVQKLWIPLGPLVSREPRNNRSLFTFARLAPGVTIGQVQAELKTVTGTLAAQYPDTNANWSAYPQTLRQVFIPPDVSLVIWMMMAGVTLVLFIACSNVANLLLARAAARRRELSVRTALGASRGQVVRQLLTESVVLALLSIPLGILLAEVGTRLIESGMPREQVPYYIQWQVDWRAFAYTLIVTVVTAIAFGLFPALQASRGNLHESLKEGTRGNSARRSLLRSSLVVVQVSLALVALISALLFVRTFANLDSYNVGFDVRPVMTMRFYMPGDPYVPADAKLRRVQDIVERVERLPGVAAAFASNMVPVSGGGGGGQVVVDGRPVEKGQEPFIDFVGVTPHFYRTLDVALVRGRDFTEAEAWAHTPYAIVNETMARRFWPDRDAVGGRFRMLDNNEAKDWFTVIGVAPDIKHDEIDPEGEPSAAVYVPYAYQQTLNTGLTIRVAGGPAAITSAVREQIRGADPNLPVFQVRTMDEVRRLGFWQYGLFGWIFGTIGVVGLLLASVGVYGVLSYAVSQRTQEIGVRVALGAARRDVLRLIVGHGVLLAAIGVGIGLVLAPVATWFGRTLFYNVSPFDPATFAFVSVFLLFVAFLASYLPARRATRVDPVIALRGE
ncbi:MAG TPA: ABC transporter permease [Vicinamibacterales bacterium]|nr:ABC transporter permease [Vicinamibacterales bacterium]